MIYLLLADTVLIVHLLFILFVALGSLLVLVNKRWIYIQIPAAVWGTIVEYKGWICPLTPLENWLRHRADVETYADSFVNHYLTPIIYPQFTDKSVQLFLAAGIIIINFSVYLCYYLKIRSLRKRR
ncbi:MAG: DUF2784 domain-containing protein [Desulfobulbaceae bacterium]|nr:DUF2784 domain-containing protein [Desulfobulbaceae bacterium]